MLDVNKVKKWYSFKFWSKPMVIDAVVKGKLTKEQYKEITGEDYPVGE